MLHNLHSPSLQRKTRCRGAVHLLRGTFHTFPPRVVDPRVLQESCEQPDSPLVIVTDASISIVRCAKFFSGLVARSDPDLPRSCQSRLATAKTMYVIPMYGEYEKAVSLKTFAVQAW